jgi:hypothetical protein
MQSTETRSKLSKTTLVRRKIADSGSERLNISARSLSKYYILLQNLT